MNQALRCRLQHKVALISGATGGIGAATAARLLAEGAKVMLLGRDSRKLRTLARDLDAVNEVDFVVAEAADEPAIAAAVAATVARFGGLDVVIANAGEEGRNQPLEQQQLEVFEARPGTRTCEDPGQCGGARTHRKSHDAGNRGTDFG